MGLCPEVPVCTEVLKVSGKNVELARIRGNRKKAGCSRVDRTNAWSQQDCLGRCRGRRTYSWCEPAFGEVSDQFAAINRFAAILVKLHVGIIHDNGSLIARDQKDTD